MMVVWLHVFSCVEYYLFHYKRLRSKTHHRFIREIPCSLLNHYSQKFDTIMEISLGTSPIITSVFYKIGKEAI